MPTHLPSHRWLAGLLALVLHAGFAYGLSQTQGMAAPASEAKPLSVHYITPPAPKPVAPPKAEKPAPPPPKSPPPRKTKPRPKPLLASKAPSARAPIATPPQPRPAPAPSRPAAKAVPAPVTAARSDLDYLANSAPGYPALSRRLGEEGTVLLRVAVSAAGEAGEVSLERSSGFERLDQAALRAVRRWRFEPARQAGAAQASIALVPIEFELKKKH